MADYLTQGDVFSRSHLLRPSRPHGRPHVRWALDIALLALSLLSIAVLLLEHGFYPDQRPVSTPVLHVLQIMAACLLAAERPLRLVLSTDRREFLREHWFDTVLLVAGGMVLVLGPSLGLGRISEQPRQMVVQFYLLGVLAARGIELNIRAASSGMHPTHLLIGSFMFLVLAGAGMLRLPRAVPPGQVLYSEDALFTAASATCVTGLSVKDVGTDFTRFGQTVIVCLIQLGGLGIMIFGTIFALFAGRRLGLRGAAAVSEMISQEHVGFVTRMIKFVVLGTLVLEVLGALLLMPLWTGREGQGFNAVFHSVSAFNNCGFALYPDNLISIRETWQVLAVVPALIILGGIGFPVLYDLLSNVPTAWRFLWRMRRRNPGVPRPRLALHTKVVLTTTVCLILIGAAGLLVLEPTESRQRQVEQQHDALQQMTDWQQMTWPQRVENAWFQSVTARTAGFNTVDLGKLSAASQLWIVLLMIIGGSPASTAGGMKTVTFAITVLLVWAALLRRQNVDVFGRSLSNDLVRRALTLAVLYVALVTTTTLLLSVAQQHSSGTFMDVLFESASACGTVGLTTGETSRLEKPGKYIIVTAMFIGRVGPLTLLMGLLVRRRPARYNYPSEGMIIG